MTLTREDFIQRIKANLYGTYGSDIDSAWNYELYRAISLTLRELIGANWQTTDKSRLDQKRVYLLSFEFMPGKMLRQNAKNLGVFDMLVDAIHSMGRSYHSIEDAEREVALGNGSLGTISMDELSTAADMRMNVWGYGLRYKKGRLKQTFKDGSQVEQPDDWESNKNPWEHEKPYFYRVDFGDYSVKAIPYDIPVTGYKNGTVNTLRIWRAEALEDISFTSFASGDYGKAYQPINRAHAIVEFLYPDDTSARGKHLRLVQEYFYASATIQDILRTFHKNVKEKRLQRITEDIAIHLNDVQTSFAIPEFIRIAMKEYKLSFDDAYEISKKLFTYTNFSVQSESFEHWGQAELNEVCPQLLPIFEKIQARVTEEIGGKFGKDSKELKELSVWNENRISLVNLAATTAKCFVTLSSAHFQAFSKVSYPVEYNALKDKVLHIRMGVSPLTWLQNINSPLHNYLSELLGVDISSFDYAYAMRQLLHFVDDPKVLDRLGQIKLEHKKRIADYVYEVQGQQINPNSIYDMQLQVVHESKRQLLNALHIAYRYFSLIDNPNQAVPEVTYFFSGKAAPNYLVAKEIIHFINALAKAVNRDIHIKDKIKIVFVEDYNMTRLQRLIPGCDVNENLGFAEKEPGGTTAIKAMMNGAINVTSRAGLGVDIIEHVKKGAVYPFGDSMQEIIDIRKSGTYSANDLYYQTSAIRQTIDRLLNASRDYIPYDFRKLYDLIMRYNDGFFIFHDLVDYAKVHDQLYQDYFDEHGWNRKVLQNIAHSGEFSMRHTLRGYALGIWDIDTKDGEVGYGKR